MSDESKDRADKESETITLSTSIATPYFSGTHPDGIDTRRDDAKPRRSESILVHGDHL